MSITSRVRVACMAVVGILTAGIFMIGCNMGNDPGVAVSGEIGGPTVPFGFSGSGRGSSEVPTQANDPMKFDATAGPTDGSGTFNNTPIVDTAAVDCDFSVGDWTDNSESGGGLGAVTGHDIRVATGPGETCADVGQEDYVDRCIECTMGGTATAPTITCAGTLPSNTVTDSDSLSVTMTCVYDFTTTGDAVDVMGVRIRYGVDSGVASPFNAFLDSSVTFTPESALSANANFTTDTDASDGQADVAYFVTTPSATGVDMGVTVTTQGSISLSGASSGAVTSDGTYTGVYTSAQYCDEAFNSTVCPDPATP